MSALKGLTFVSSVHRRVSECLDLFQVLGFIMFDLKNASRFVEIYKGEGGGNV